MTIAKHHVDYALMTWEWFAIFEFCPHEKDFSAKTVSDPHHLVWLNNLRFAHRRKQCRARDKPTMKAERVGVVSSRSKAVVTVASRYRMRRPVFSPAG